MLYTKEQVTNGLINYIDNEVVNQLPTAGKWIVGTAAALVMKNIDKINTETMEMLGIVSNDGMWDVDMLASSLKENARRYGNIQITYPIVGTMVFTPEDIDLARGYIK